MSESAKPAQPRLRIAVLHRQFSTFGGGAERYSIALVEQLAERYEIHVFSQHIDHSWPGVTYHTVPQPLKRPRWLNQLWYATATWWSTRKGFDLVHSHENTWHGQVQTVHVVPVKFNLLNGLTGWKLALRWLKIATSVRLLVYLVLERRRFALHLPRTIVLTSNTLVAQMMAAYPASGKAIKVVMPGVNQVHGAPSVLQKMEYRHQLGLPVEGFCILFVGNDYRKKGLVTLLQALSQMPANCYLAVVGNPAQIPSFRSQVATLGLEQRVFFLGTMKDISHAYQAADCLAHPTLEDTFAMVVLEALAHGLPVVVSNQRYCGIAGLLRHELNALVLEDPWDIDALAVELMRLVREPNLAICLQMAGLAFAADHRWLVEAQRQADIYEAIAVGKNNG